MPGKGFCRSGQQQLHQFTVVVLTHLLGQKESAGRQYAVQLWKYSSAHAGWRTMSKRCVGKGSGLAASASRKSIPAVKTVRQRAVLSGYASAALVRA